MFYNVCINHEENHKMWKNKRKRKKEKTRKRYFHVSVENRIFSCFLSSSRNVKAGSCEIFSGLGISVAVLIIKWVSRDGRNNVEELADTWVGRPSSRVGNGFLSREPKGCPSFIYRVLIHSWRTWNIDVTNRNINIQKFRTKIRFLFKFFDSYFL